MAWQIPKTNWQSADIVTKNDFNRIEGNIQELENTKETHTGAQAKADAAETNAKAYADNVGTAAIITAKDYTDQEVGEVAQELTSHKADKVAHIDYAVASGTNSYTVSIPGITTLVEGLSVKIKFTNANTGTATLNINGLGAKQIRKSNGNALSAGNIKAGQICHLVYTGSVFQLLGEGGEYGTAQPQHVLQGYTIGTEQGIVAGTMPNQGQKIITPSTVNIAIPQGYHDGTGYVVGDSDLKASNIRNGVNIFGVVGNVSPAIDFSQAPIIDTTIDADASGGSEFGGSKKIYAYSTTTPCKAVVFTGNIRAYAADNYTGSDYSTNVTGYVKFMCKASGATFYIVYAHTDLTYVTSGCEGDSFMLINSGESYLRLTPWGQVKVEFGALSFYDLSGGFDIYCYIYANARYPTVEAQINGHLWVW